MACSGLGCRPGMQLKPQCSRLSTAPALGAGLCKSRGAAAGLSSSSSSSGGGSKPRSSPRPRRQVGLAFHARQGGAGDAAADDGDEQMAEVEALREAMDHLRDALGEVRSNTDDVRGHRLRQTLLKAREDLKSRLRAAQTLAGEPGTVPLNPMLLAAIAEASALLDEAAMAMAHGWT